MKHLGSRLLLLLSALGVVAILAAILPDLAWAAQSGGGSSGHGLSPGILFFIQITLLLIVGRILGEVAQRVGQPAVMGQLVAGILLGPSVLGLAWPEMQDFLFPAKADQRRMLEGVAQLGVLLLLLLTGMETDFGLIKRVKRAAILVSLAGITIPFTLGAATGWLLPDWMLPHPDKRIVTALFLGTALSISSVKIVAMVIRDMGFTRRNLGQVIMAAAIIDDTIGWIIIGVVLGIAQVGHLELMTVGQSVLGTALFLILSFTLGRRLVALAIRLSNDHLKSEFAVVTTILVVMFLMALTTEAIGVHTVLGAFVAGVLVGHSPILTRHIDEQLRGLVSGLFAPVFFGIAGLSANLTVLANPRDLALTAGLVAIASIGKFAGAFAGAGLAGLSRREALALGCGMNARGSTEVIVASIGLAMGALNRDLYTMIVTMAVVTTLMMPPMLRWALARLPVSEEEKRRLEREAFEAKGFVPNIERVLLATDSGPNARLASRLAGLLAGSRQILTTVLPVQRIADAGTDHGEAAGDAVRQAARTTLRRDEDGAAGGDGNVHVDVRPASDRASAKEAVELEARKGFDLMLIGVEDAATDNGGVGAHASELALGFEGPFALAVAKGSLVGDPERSPLQILVPVDGTATTRRAAEVAIDFASAIRASVTAVHVLTEDAGTVGRLALWRGLGANSRANAVLREVVQIADQYEVEVRTEIVRRRPPADAILAAAARHGTTLIVLGVDKRQHEGLYFGAVAEKLLEKAPCALLLVSG